MKRSTGLRNYMLDTGSFRAAIAGMVIKIYSGVMPASADDALGSAVLLCTISVDGTGTGITMATTASAGVLQKNADEIWTGDVTANGTASFFRIATNADDGSFSTAAMRIQGTVGLVGAEMNFSSINFIIGDARRVNYFVATIPAG